MKKLAAVLFLLLAIQSWGVYGAARTQGLRYKCTTEIGPLCYAWEERPLAKLFGEDQLEKLEDQLEDFRDELADKLSTKEKSGLEEFFEDISEIAEEGAKNAKKLLDE